jgi:hypothetical protein
MLWTLQVGAKSVSQQATGEWVASFSYAGAAPYPCRVYDGPAASLQQRFGVTLATEAVALVPAGAGILAVRLSAAAGDRQQVRITDAAGGATLWEVLYATDLGNVGLYRALALKRWV